jgi:hypothetical protein
MGFEFREASYDPNDLPMREFREFLVERGSASIQAVRDFEALLDSSPNETYVQAFLSQNPWMLAPWAGPGPARWILPQKRLGAEYVTDFLAADWRSLGVCWAAIELESPKAKMLTKNGDYTAQTNHAIRQIKDWRTWLGNNINYASRPRCENGLGLKDIDSRVKGIIFIGRRNQANEGANARRRQDQFDSGISLHTFDSLIDSARQEAEHRNALACQGL